MHQNHLLSICWLLVIHGWQARCATESQGRPTLMNDGPSSDSAGSLGQHVGQGKDHETHDATTDLAKLLLHLDPSSAFGPVGTSSFFSREHPGFKRSQQVHRNARPMAAAPETSQPKRTKSAQWASANVKVDPELVDELSRALLEEKLSTDSATAAQEAPRPGRRDKELFTNDPTCRLWEEFKVDYLQPPLEKLQAAAAIPAKYMPKPFEGLGGALKAIDYWAKHAARTSFFVANGLAGVAAFQFLGQGSASEEAKGKQSDEKKRRIQEAKAKGFGSEGFEEAAEMGLETAAQLAASQILESVMVYEQDWQRILKGNYAMPWDLSAGHRQNTLPYALQQSARVIEETMGILGRRTRGAPEDRKIWLQSSDSIYPQYYKTNYHYQTDGWMSTDSADVYETSTETIFFGRQDAQQRAALVPLQGLRGVNGRPLKILEVACGTGRFGTFIRDNHPTAELTYVDLSPFYLEKARENDEYWRNFRSSQNGGKAYEPAKFVQAAAEALPFEAERFDVVVCVYLFHEMPEGPRAAAAAEMARVLSPGGTLVFSDSIQRGDRPVLDDVLGGFGDLNEPHYRNYITTSIPDLFTPYGLECGHRYVACTSKTLSFTKPKNTATKQMP